MKTSEELVGGAFAYMEAPFAVHPNDSARALEWLKALIEEGKTWADAEQQIKDYFNAKGMPMRAVEECKRAKPMIAPWL